MVRETRHLWVGNLPHTIREERILDHFKRYGKVQSVKILPKKEEESGACATVAFIDIKSAAKAHGADNKIEERTLRTDYYEPPAPASSAIFIHDRPAPPYARPNRYPGLPEERNYERPGHYYDRVADREPYLRRPIGMGYHDEDNYQGRAKSRDRYSRSTPANNYTDGTDRNQNHFRTHNARQHFEPQRYPGGDQYGEERDPAAARLTRRASNAPAPVPAAPTSPTPARPNAENRPRRAKARRSPSRTPSGSRSNSGSHSRSSSGSRSSSSSSKLRSSSSDSSARSRSPSKSRSPAASFGSQSNTKSNRLDRPSSAIANPSSTACFLPSAVNNTSTTNCTPILSQPPPPPTPVCVLAALENHSEGCEKRPLGICVRNLPVRSTDTSLKDGLFHEYKKHGKVTMVKVIGQGTDRYAVVCFKKPEDVDKALEVSKDKLFFGCKIEVTAHEGLDAEDNEFRPLEAELDEFHPKATRTLFIGNLEKDITTAELRKHFDQFGEIIEIDIKKQGSATSYAFIQYSDIGSVVKAMRKLDGENLGANRIKLGFGKSMPTNCVWLDGIVDTVSEKFLARHFSRFGMVAYTAVDREKGHALVFYESVEFAQIAVSEMRGRILGGKKLQVDFASRECQTTFFDKLEMTGQMVPGDGTRPWERRERRTTEFEVVRNEEREVRTGFENRVYPRYEAQARPARGNFRGCQRAGFTARGRGQGFPQRYEVYHDEFGERRHRYNSREESGGENSSFEGKPDRPKYVESTECPNRKRNKLRNSISDQESHHSQSPPRSRHHSRSNSPVLKERKPVKDRIHHRVKSPGSQNSSQLNSPCRDGASDDMDLNTEYIRDFRTKCPDLKIELSDVITDLSFSHVSPRSGSEKDPTEKSHSKSECDSNRSRSMDAESSDEVVMTSDQQSQMERKKRFLASSNLKGCKELNSLSKSFPEKVKLKSPVSNSNSLKTNCVSDSLEDIKSEVDSSISQEDCVKDKPHPTEGGNTDLKFLQKRQVHILHLLEQLRDGVNPNDADVTLECEQLARKKHRSSSCIEAFDDDISKSLTKDEYAKLLKASLKDPSILARLKSKADSVDGNNCIAISLDSFIFRKHLDPRKSFDQHSVNSLQKCRRISVDSDSCLPNSQGNSESFICVPASLTSDVSWKKQCGSLNDLRFSDNDTDESISSAPLKINDDILSHKTTSTLPIDLQKSFVALKSFDNLPCHEIKRERDISPLSLPLPKFAASLRSPKSSPSTLTSPKSTTAHSPRAGQSPSSYMALKNMRIPELLQEMPNDKKTKDVILEEKVNGANIFPFNLIPSLESHVGNESSELTPCMEPIQSPKSNCEKIKESNCSSESDFSPASSPNRPSIEDRIKALDEKFNAWSGSARTPNSASTDSAPATPAAIVPVTIDIPKSQVKRSRFNFLAPDVKSEPSEIVKSLLAKSTIFDQDSKRLQHIDEKYEPLSVKMDLSPKIKPTFRTKAAAKEFSIPITTTVQTFNQSVNPKPTSSLLVAQGIMSPPSTSLSATNSILSPVTPPLSQLSPQVVTPCSPRSTVLSAPTTVLKNPEGVKEEKDVIDHVLTSTHTTFNSIRAKNEAVLISNSACVSTAKSMTAGCHVEIPTHGLKVSSPPIKKEPLSPPCPVQALCKIELDSKVSVKKEAALQSPNIPIKKDCSLSSVKEQSLKHFNSVDAERKDFCDSKDPRLSHHDSSGHWRETGCRDATKTNVDSSAKSQVMTTGSDMTDPPTHSASKKRVLSIDSNESDSSKSQKSLESNRDNHDTNWSKHEKVSEPETKKPKISKTPRERSHSPTHHSAKKSEKKEKCQKPERSKSCSSKSSEKDHHDSKCSSKGDSKDKSVSDNKFKDEKRYKSRDNKESTSKSEQQRTSSKSRERRSSEKDNKSGHSNTKSRKESSSKNEKEGSSSKSEKESSSSKSEKESSCKSEKEISSKNEKESSKSEKEHSTSKNEKEHSIAKSEKEHSTFRSEKEHSISKSEKEHSTSKSEKEHSMYKSEKEHSMYKSEKEHSTYRSEKENSTSKIEKESSSSKNDKENSQRSKSEREDSTSKSDKAEKPKMEKKSERKSGSSKSKSKHDDFSFLLDEEPVYFSMYDKVKARSSKTQTFKNQAKDLESMRQKFSKLKQSRAKREDKSKSIDQDSDKDSDSASHHSSESDSQTISSSTKSSSKLKQQRKRKLVIESSSSDDNTPQDRSSRMMKSEKDFSDSGTDSDFEFNVSQRQSNSSQCSRNRKKKSELLESDSSDSDAHFPSRMQSSMKKKSSQHRLKHKSEKCKKILKSDEDMSDMDISSKPQSKEKFHKTKKMRKEKSQEFRSENEAFESDACKKNEDMKVLKKKQPKDIKQEHEGFSSQRKSKSELKETKHKVVTKERKVTNSEKMSVDEAEKHKPYNKKRKKSKKISRNKEKRMSSDKESRKHLDESDTKCSLPVLLSPKPSTSPMQDKLLSPPHLQAGLLSDCEMKSDFSDFDFESHETCDLDASLWNQSDSKPATNPEKSYRSKKKDLNVSSKSHSDIHSSEQEYRMPSFFDKLSDVTDSETGHDPIDTSTPCDKKRSFSHKKEREIVLDGSPRKIRHDKHVDSNSKHETLKPCDTFSSSSREEKRRKKYKKQCKEKKKKSKTETLKSKDNSVDLTSIDSPKSLQFDLHHDEDSKLSDIRLNEEIAEEARRLEQQLLAVSEETNTFGDEGPSKREEKILERRFEEEAAKETRRLEAELFSTGRESWHMKDKEYDSEVHSEEIHEDKPGSDIESMVVKEENIFASLDLHSSMTEASQNEADVFLPPLSENDPYKLEDKDVSNDIEDQRKLEDDLAVSALLQEMHCSEISAPDLTKETDYLDPLMDDHPEDTMNYLLPDDGENSLHIADNSPDMQANESQEAKLESSMMLLSPSSNSEPPSLEISTVEDSVLLKLDNFSQSCHSENVKLHQESGLNTDNYHANAFDFTGENSLEACESKPPVIDIPAVIDTMEYIKASVSPKIDSKKNNKKKQREKSDRNLSKTSDHCRTSEETDDDEANSELGDNQLSHFEDITMDTTDSKDDDNPPILLPVESPHNRLPLTLSKEKSCVEPLTKVENEPIHLDNIIDKVPPANETHFDKVSDLDKQIGDIINSITELKKQTFENNPMRTSSCSNRSPIPIHIPDFSDHNSDSLLGSNPKLFSNSKQDTLLATLNKLDQSLLDSSKETTMHENANISIGDKITGEKFKNSEQVKPCHTGAPLSFYSEILKSSCETSVIQPLSLSENKVSVSKWEKPNFLNNNLEKGQSSLSNSISELNQASDDNFIIDIFKTREEKAKVQTKLDLNEPESNICDYSGKSEVNIKDNYMSSLDHHHQDAITPLFEIPEVNEQNEATEFNQDIFERPSEHSKETHLPHLLTFSSEQLFPEGSTRKLVEEPPANNSAILSDEVKKTDNAESLQDLSGTEKNSGLIVVNEGCLADNISEASHDLAKDLEESEVKEDVEDTLDNKSGPGDLESCSDTTDIIVPDTKVEMETNNVTSGEDQMQDVMYPLDESVPNPKPKPERSRRGKRGKGRKHVDVSQRNDLPLQEAVPNQIHVRNTGRRVRVTSERIRRSLRRDATEAATLKEGSDSKIILGGRIEATRLDEDDTKSKDNSENMTSSLTDSAIAETDCSNASHGESDVKLGEKQLTTKGEPRKRRGRKKKSSGDHISEKSEPKVDEIEQSKEFHRPKEPRLWQSLLSEKEQKALKENLNKTIDVYDFPGSDEDDNLPFESVKERLHENNRSTEQKHDAKTSEIMSKKDKRGASVESKHDSKTTDVIPEKDKKGEEAKSKPSRFHDNARGFVSDQKFDPKASEVVLEKDKKSEEAKSKPSRYHSRGASAAEVKHAKANETLSEKDKKVDEVKPKPSRFHDSARTSLSDQKHDVKVSEALPDREKKSETKSKNSSIEERESSKDHGKLILTLRVQKDSQDAEVIKTSLHIEKTKPDNSKSERNSSSKQDASSSDNGLCSSRKETTRKSPRLANQAARSHDGQKGKNSTSSEPIQTRAARIKSSKSNRRSEENPSITIAKTPEDLAEDKNKNEPVFIILDNAVKDVPEEKKPILYPVEPVTTANSSKSEKVTDSTANLRAFRMKEHTNTSSSIGADHDSLKREASLNTVNEKINVSRKENTKNPKASLAAVQDSTIAHKSPPPVAKVELPNKIIINTKEIIIKEEKIEIEEDSDSRSSTAQNLVDPVTGILPNANTNSAELLPEGLNQLPSNIDVKPNIDKKPSIDIKPSIDVKPNPNLIISDSGTSTPSVLNSVIPALPSTVDLSALSGINHEALKTKSNNVNDNPHIGRSPLTPNITRQMPISAQQTPVVASGETISESNAKVLSSAEKTCDQVKLPAKKNLTSAIGAVTIADSVVSTSPAITLTCSTSTPAPSSVSNTSIATDSVLSTGNNVLSLNVHSKPISDKIDTSDTNVAAPKMPHMSVVQQVHSYQPPVRAIVTTVVTATSSIHSASMPATAQTKCSASATIVPPIVIKTEALTPTNAQSPHIEHTSSVSCKPAIITTAVSPDLPIAVGKYDTSAASSVTTPVNSTWSNSKASSGNRIVVPTDAHVSTIQNMTSQLMPTPKSDLRSHALKSPHIHMGKNNAAYVQQAGFTVPGYDTAMLSAAHGLAPGSNVSGGVIAEFLQNPQFLQQHKDYFAAVPSGPLQDRIQGQLVRPPTPVVSGIPPDIATRLGNPTPPHTPTPPVSSTNHLQSDIHPIHVNSGLHHRQSSLIVQPMHPDVPSMNPYVHQMMYVSHPHYLVHPDIRAQQDARDRGTAAAAIGINPRFPYPPLPHSAMSANFRQPSEARPLSASMEMKPDPKSMNDLSKLMHEGRGNDDKSHHPIKSIRSKKEDKELKIMHSDCRDELEGGRHISPVDRHLYAASQSRVQQLPLAGQVDDHKTDGTKVSQAHHYKSDLNDREMKQPPIAHQNPLSAISHHHLEAVHLAPMQQLLGVSTGHVDGRSSNPTHSPSALAYKKDASMYNPNDKRLGPEMPKKVVPLVRTLREHQGSSISPGPQPWSAVMQPHNPHPSYIIPPAERRPPSAIHTPQIGPELHAPPPAHAMSQPTNIPRTLPQTPPHASQVPPHSSQVPPHGGQVPPHGDTFILQRYPVMWQGLLALKNDQAAVQMHFVSGNPTIATASLPSVVDGELPPVRIFQRMRLEQTQLEGVARKMQIMDEHCILMALPCGKHHMDCLQQTSNLKNGFINYLQLKQAAGIVNTPPGSQQPAYVIHIFPSCEFSDSSLARFAPDLLHIICDIAHLVIIIATV